MAAIPSTERTPPIHDTTRVPGDSRPSSTTPRCSGSFPVRPAVNLPEGSSEFGITNIAATARIDLGNASQFNDAARTIGNWVAAQGASAAQCESFGTTACVDTFLGWFPEAAYRRPLSAEEVDALRSVYDDVEPTYGAEWAFSALVRAVLLSPQFLYRYEVGPGPARAWWSSRTTRSPA